MESPGGIGTGVAVVTSRAATAAIVSPKDLELSVTNPISSLRAKLAEQLAYETKLLSSSTAPITERSKVMAKLGEIEQMLDPIFEGLGDWAGHFTKVVAERKALAG